MPRMFANLCGLLESEVSSITKHLCYWLIFQQPPTKTSWPYGKCCSSQFGKCVIQHHIDMQIFQKQKTHTAFTAKHSSNLSNSTFQVTGGYISHYCHTPGQLENLGFKPCSSLDFSLYHCIWTGSETNPTSHPTSTSMSLYDSTVAGA